MPRIAADKKDYNLAMDPKLLQAGKVVAASEDRKLAELLRFLLKQHIERNGGAQARQIYSISEEIPHGTPIVRSGKTKDLAIQLPEELYERIKAEASRQERSVTSLVRRSIERYLEALVAVPAVDEVPKEQLDIVSEIDKLETKDEAPRNQYGETMEF